MIPDIIEEKLLLFIQVIFPAESFHPTGGIDQLLFSGKEGMAIGTDLHLDILDRRTGLDYMPAGAGYLGRVVFGVNLRFHFSTFFSSPQIIFA
jgi:hypothetical protein